MCEQVYVARVTVHACISETLRLVMEDLEECGEDVSGMEDFLRYLCAHAEGEPCIRTGALMRCVYVRFCVCVCVCCVCLFNI